MTGRQTWRDGEPEIIGTDLSGWPIDDEHTRGAGCG